MTVPLQFSHVAAQPIAGLNKNVGNSLEHIRKSNFQMLRATSLMILDIFFEDCSKNAQPGAAKLFQGLICPVSIGPSLSSSISCPLILLDLTPMTFLW